MIRARSGCEEHRIPEPDPTGGTQSRRTFLRGMGVAGVVLVAPGAAVATPVAPAAVVPTVLARVRLVTFTAVVTALGTLYPQGQAPRPRQVAGELQKLYPTLSTTTRRTVELSLDRLADAGLVDRALDERLALLDAATTPIRHPGAVRAVLDLVGLVERSLALSKAR